MRTIDIKEVQREMNNGAGYTCLLGNSKSKNGKHILSTKAGFLLFEEHEINGLIWKTIMEDINKEKKEQGV